MTPERWARIAPLIDDALELDTNERLAYVESVSEGDPELRADLTRLISKSEAGASLLDRAAAERFALLLAEADEQMPRMIGDRFVVVREIGRGGMATVLLAHDQKHDRPVAVKVLRRDVAASIGAERFLREIRTAARLQHPHIMPLHDSGEADGLVYYVMPFAPGETLRERLAREHQLPLEDALHIARDVAGALDHAHRNEIVHRDVKPENIFLSDGHALVMDFGIARAISGSRDEDTITVPGLAIGTPAYMSPEQATAGSHLDGRTDIYALGCVVYEMLAGHAPFMGTTSREVLARHALDPVPPLRRSRPEVPDSTARAVEKALAKAPADRFRTATEFVDACQKSSPASE
ncbi:MAG TPA: serine/threonine-protein kinase, partial [Gemmatimonadaceae bacterium]|nr:serine/threonine-protein kinase [Gemmatimonadaceae bacterium]